MADINLNAATYEQIVTLLSQLATNYSNLAGTFYDVFYNPTPENVSFKMFDESGVLKDFTVKNLALSNSYRMTGDGEPTVGAEKGTLYQDLTSGDLYIKTTDSAVNGGWKKLINSALLDTFIRHGSGNPNGVVSADLGTLYVDVVTATLYICTGDKVWAPVNASFLEFANRNLDNITQAGRDVIGTEIEERLGTKTETIDGGSTHFQIPTALAVYNVTNDLANTKQDKSNLTTVLSDSSTDAQYPSAKVVYDTLVEKQDKSNLTTVLNDNSTDTQYPSAKVVYDKLQEASFITTGSIITGSQVDFELKTQSLGNGDWVSVTFDDYNNCYVALESHGYMATSADGVQWTAIGSVLPSTFGSVTLNWVDIKYVAGKGVAISEEGYYCLVQGTHYSNLTHVASETSYTNYSLYKENDSIYIYAGGVDQQVHDVYAGIVYSGGTIRTGITLSRNVILSGYYTFKDVCNFNNANIMLIDAPNSRIAVKISDVTYNIPNLAGFSWEKVAYDGKGLLLISAEGYTSYSSDGIRWSAPKYLSNLGNNSWCSIVYNNGQYVVISETGYCSYATSMKKVISLQGSVGSSNKPIYLSGDVLTAGYTPVYRPHYTDLIPPKVNLNSGGATSGSYQAPQDGWIYFDFSCSGKTMSVSIGNCTLCERTNTGSNMTCFTGIYPIRAGETCTFANGYMATTTYSSQAIYFIPTVNS